jgi:DNA polymerase-3 subunit gamma/tau
VAWTAFHAAAPISLTGGVLAVAVAEPGHVRAIAQRGHDERLRQAIIDALGLDVRIDVLHDPDASGGGRGAAAPAAGPAPDARPSRGSRAPASPAAASGGSGSGGPRSEPAPGSRGSDLVRAAAGGTADADPEPADEPSADDPDLDSSGGDGLALITRELGARPIGEIDHS